MVKVAFFEYLLQERGTTVAMFDYAYFNKKLLSNESIIIHRDNNYSKKYNNNPKVVEKFKKNFDIFEIKNFDEVDEILVKEKVDILYMLKYGSNDNEVSKVCKTVVHAVFTAEYPHGDIYLPISPSVKGYNESLGFVPHMINLPDHQEDLREKLGIPKKATVFGRYGGFDKFNIIEAQRAVVETALRNNNIYFLFANTKQFCKPKKNIIFLDMIIEEEIREELNFASYEKVRFINTCDAMIWGRSDGECFGIAIGEFSSKNKPIIATKKCKDKAHVLFLGDKGIWYDSTKSLIKILNNFDKELNSVKDWNCYRDFEPEKVMKIFEDKFLVLD